jgi:hypothetical protein
MGTYAARSLQGGGGAGYDDSSVSDITHSVGAVTAGALHTRPRMRRETATRPDVAAGIAVWEVAEDE